MCRWQLGSKIGVWQLIIIKHTSTEIHKYNLTNSPILPSIQVTNENIHQAHKQIWHLSSYAMRIDTTLYACGTGHHQGRYLKIHICIIFIANMNTKYLSHRQYGYKYPVFANMDINIRLMNAWTYDPTMHTFIQQINNQHQHFLIHAYTIKVIVICM